jgi:hypothetical protein
MIKVSFRATSQSVLGSCLVVPQVPIMARYTSLNVAALLFGVVAFAVLGMSLIFYWHDQSIREFSLPCFPSAIATSGNSALCSLECTFYGHLEDRACKKAEFYTALVANHHPLQHADFLLSWPPGTKLMYGIDANSSLCVIVVDEFVVNVEAQVVPVAQCWLVKNEGGQSNTLFFFGYNNQGTTNVTVPVSENNYFTAIVETGADPITSFLSGFHGLSQVVTVPANLELNQSIALTWVLNGLAATVNSNDATHRCSDSEIISFIVSAPDATQSNPTGVQNALATAAGLNAAQVDISSSSTAKSISGILLFGGPTNPFEAMYNIYSAFVNPNDGSLRGALDSATGASVTDISGGQLSHDIPGTPFAPAPLAPSDAPVAPVIVPIAHCWEPTTNASDGHSFMYFGYMSTFTSVQYIESDTPQNQFVGAPSLASPFPVFYPGINGFVTRLRIRDGSLVQWNLNGYAVLLDAADVNFACDASINELGLFSASAWSSGSYNSTSAQAGTDAISTVSHLPLNNVQSSWTNVNGGGFRGLFNLTAGNEESVYTAMWRTISDYHLANSTLTGLWIDAFGAAPANYSSAGTANDVFGSQLPPSSNLHVPVAHCWTTAGPNNANTKFAYFGYLSNYPNTLSYLQGQNNWVANIDGWTTPTVLYPGYNGFAVVLTASGDASSNTNVAWNLAGNTVSIDLTNTSLQCRPNRPVSFTVTYNGVLLADIDQVSSANQISQYVQAKMGNVVSDVLVQFDASPLGFYATVTATPSSPSAQYSALAQFVQSCNSLNSFSVRASLSSFAGNASVQYCQATGTSLDSIGASGVSAETHAYGEHAVTIFANCWNPNGNGITGYFGYNSTSPFSYFIRSTITPGNYIGQVPQVFTSSNDPYAARIESSTNSISWTLGSQTASLSTANADNQCSGNMNATVTLAFERKLQQPPQEDPIIEFIASLTGFPDTHIFATWSFESSSDFSLNVLFSSLASSKKDISQEPIAAATYLVRQLSDNSTAAAAISNAAGCHIYSATTGVYTPPNEVPPTAPNTVPVAPVGAPTPTHVPVAPVAPVAPSVTPTAPSAPSAPSVTPTAKKSLSGALVFGIIVGVLLGVGIIGGILFYFCKYHKGMCRDDLETRPLLQD